MYAKICMGFEVFCVWSTPLSSWGTIIFWCVLSYYDIETCVLNFLYWGTLWWVPNGRLNGWQVVTFFEGRSKTIGVLCSLFTSYLRLTNPKSWVFYPKFHSVVYIPIIQNQFFLRVTPHGKATFLISKRVVIRV